MCSSRVSRTYARRSGCAFMPPQGVLVPNCPCNTLLYPETPFCTRISEVGTPPGAQSVPAAGAPTIPQTRTAYHEVRPQGTEVLDPGIGRESRSYEASRDPGPLLYIPRRDISTW